MTFLVISFHNPKSSSSPSSLLPAWPSAFVINMFIHMHVAILLNHLSSSSSLSWSPWSSSSSSSSSSSPSRSPCLLILAHPCFHVPLHCLQVCVLEIALRISERPQSRASFAKLVLKRKALSKSEFWPPGQRCQRQSLRRRMLYHSLNFQCQARWRMPHWAVGAFWSRVVDCWVGDLPWNLKSKAS